MALADATQKAFGIKSIYGNLIHNYDHKQAGNNLRLSSLPEQNQTNQLLFTFARPFCFENYSSKN